MSKPLVSICIPCYNAENYVGQAIDSVLSQSWPEIEIIVINDGSTDNSQAILDSYASKTVNVIHQDNRGQCAAANRAYSESQGDLIKFFDADDLLSPEFIESQVRRLSGRIDAVATAKWGRFYNDDPFTFKLNEEPVWRDLQAQQWLIEAWNNAKPMMQCALWLIPRPILEKSGVWDESLSLINDFEFFARVLCHANEVLFTPEATLYYRSGIEGSLSAQKSRLAVESAFNSLLRGTDHLLGCRNDPEARLSCANVLQNFIYTFYPNHSDLRAVMQQRISELGGSNLKVTGGPRFHNLRRLIGWKLAKRLQKQFIYS